MQGRPELDEWVTKIKVAFTLDGEEWEYINNGLLF